MAINPKKDAFDDAELTSLAIEIINDAGWLKNPHFLDANDEFITELAKDISREIQLKQSVPDMNYLSSSKSTSTNISYATSSSSSISSSYTEPSNASMYLQPHHSSHDHLFFISCPDIKAAKSRSHPRFPSRNDNIHKSAQPKRSSPHKPTIIRYPDQRTRAVKHVIAFPKDKRKPVLCSPFYAAQYQEKWKSPAACLSSRDLTPNAKACAVPDFCPPAMELNNDCCFGDIVTKGAPQKYKKNKKKKTKKKKKIKHIVVEKKATFAHCDDNKSKLRLYKKRDKCDIKIKVANVKHEDHEYSFVSSPSSNDSMYNNEGVQPNNTNQTECDRHEQEKGTNGSEEGQLNDVDIQTGLATNE